jgi:hypothetical protein
MNASASSNAPPDSQSKQPDSKQPTHNPITNAVGAVVRTPPPAVAAPDAASAVHQHPHSEPPANRRNQLGGGGVLLRQLEAAAGPNDFDGEENDAEEDISNTLMREDDYEEVDRSDEKGTFALARKRIAPLVIESVRNTGQTFTAYAENKRLQARNYKEVIAWGQAIDAYLHSNPPLPLNTEALELMIRRFIGVIEADRHRNWNVADVLALRPTSGTTLTRELELQMLMDANKLERTNKYAHKVAAPIYRSNASYGPNGNTRMFTPRPNGGTTAGTGTRMVTSGQNFGNNGTWNRSQGNRGAGKPQRISNGGAGASFQ